MLEGSGLSWQSSGSKDVRAYAIRKDDVLLHPAQGDAHTLIAGDDGLTVLVVAEGSRTHLTWLPRAKQFWVGPRWSPADMPPPFAADAQLGPIEGPEPTAERPPTIRNLADLPLHEGVDGAHRLRHARRPRHGLGAARARDGRDAARHAQHRPALPFHPRGVLVRARGLGHRPHRGEAHELRAGSFWLRRPNGGVGHRIEVGPDGMDLVTMGDLVRPTSSPIPKSGSSGWRAASSCPTSRRTERAPPRGEGTASRRRIPDSSPGSTTPTEAHEHPHDRHHRAHHRRDRPDRPPHLLRRRRPAGRRDRPAAAPPRRRARAMPPWTRARRRARPPSRAARRARRARPARAARPPRGRP